MHVIIEDQFRVIVETELKDKGWTRSELARRMGVAQPFVSNYLNGRNTPGPDVMERFFEALGLRPRLVVEKNAMAGTPER